MTAVAIGGPVQRCESVVCLFSIPPQVRACDAGTRVPRARAWLGCACSQPAAEKQSGDSG